MRNLPREVKDRSLSSYLILTISILIALGGCSTAQKELKPLVFPSPPEEPRFVYEATIRSGADIKDITTSDKFLIFATGSAGESFGLSKPYGVAVREGRIYVSDTVQRAVLMFDAPRGETKFIGTDGPGRLLKPLGIDTSSNGDVYVADNTAKRVVVFDKDGNFLRALGNKDNLERPSGVTISPDGKLAYVVDTGGIDSERHNVVVFDTQSGEHLSTIGKRGVNDGEFNLPLQAATGPDGTLYVVDTGNFRIEAFNPDNSFKFSWGKAGRNRGDFSRPKGVATDNEGNIYIADAAFGNFQIFSKDRELLLFIGNRDEQGGPAKYMLPAGIDVDEDGRIYLIDQYFSKLEIFRPAKLTREDGYLGTRYREQIQKEMKESKKK